MQWNTQQFEALVGQHQRMVFSIALRVVGEHGTAEEVAQDVFVELHRSMDKIESEEHTVYWLRRVAVHRATDALRRRRVRPEATADEWEEHTSAPKGPRLYRKGSIETVVERLMLSIPESLRGALVLRYQEDLEPEEIAKVLGQTVPSVKSNLHRGLTLLRRKADVMLKEFARG